MEKPVNGSSYQREFSSISEHNLQNVFLEGLCSQNPHMGPGGNDPPNQFLPSPIPCSEDDGQSIPLKDSSHVSIQMPSAKNFSSLGGGGKKEGLSGPSGISACQNSNGKSSMISDQVFPQNQVASFEIDIEGQSKFIANGITSNFPAELDSSNMQESCVSSVMDEVSLEASSFRQLQLVMEKLDIKTKLCIRDSLYRLARSAEHRHKCTIASGESGNGVWLSDETDECSRFMDVETDTNPIDRSIAHLLFHRPSDASTKSLTMANNTSKSGPSLAVEKPKSQEESSGVVAE